MADRSEVTVQRLEDINTKFVAALTALNGSEFRIKRLEEELSHTKESYSVVHRFMVNYMDRHRSGSTSPRSGYNSRSVSPRTRGRPSSRTGSPGSYYSRSTLREMLEETQMNMLKNRYPSVTEEDGSDDADESESSEEETQVTSRFEEIVRKRTNAKLAEETEDQVGAAVENTEDKNPEGKPKGIPSRLFLDKKSRKGMETGDEGDSEMDATERRKSHGAVRHDTDKYKEKTFEEEKISRRVREEGRRHHSGSSSLARASNDRRLSDSQNKKSNIRRSSRGSRKNSAEDKIFSPSRVSFMGFESNRYATEDSDTDAVGHGEGRRYGSGGDRHHTVQRSVSTPGEPSGARRESPSRYERSHSSTSSRPRIRVIPPSSPPPPIIKINAEYTSLADELENVVMARLSPPTTPHVRFGRVRHYTEGLGVSLRGFHNPLRDAEEADFLIMEGLIQKRLYRDSENLAVSLEELCSIHTDTSDHEISVVIQSQLQQSDAGFTIEKSPTMQEMGTCYDPDFLDITSPSGPDIIPSNRNRKLGHLGDLKKRHSIGVVDTSKLTQSRPAYTAIDVGSQPSDPSVSYDSSPPPMATSTPQNTAQGTRECPHPPPVRLASPEQTSINSPNSPHLTRAVPQNLTLPACGMGLLPPRRMLASPVHSLLIVDQSVVPLTLTTSDPQGSLLPPSQPLASPVLHHMQMHASSQPEHLPMQQQQFFRKCDASILSTSSSRFQRPSSPAGGLSVGEGVRAVPYSLANPSLPSFLYPTTISTTTTTLLHVKSGGRSPTTAGLFTVPSSQGHPEPLTSVPELKTSLSPPPGGRSPTYSSSGVDTASSLFQGQGAYHAPSQTRGLGVSDSIPAASVSLEAYSTTALPKMQSSSLSRDLSAKDDTFHGGASSVTESCSKPVAAGGKEDGLSSETLSIIAGAGVDSSDKGLESSDLATEHRKTGSRKNLTETEC